MDAALRQDVSFARYAEHRTDLHTPARRRRAVKSATSVLGIWPSQELCFHGIHFGLCAAHAPFVHWVGARRMDWGEVLGD